MLRLFIFAVMALVTVQVRGQVPAEVTTKKNLPYVKQGHERQQLDLFLPKRADKSLLPVVIYVHGGAWKEGSKEQCPLLGLLQHGFAVVSINYRLSQHAVFPAQIQDCKAAVRYVRAHAAEWGIDPKRVGVCGASAGGHLVALLGTACNEKSFEVGEYLDQSSRPDCVCNYFGVSDLMTIHEQSDPKISVLKHNTANSPESALLGAPVTSVPEKARAASPVNYVSKDDPPMLMLHGSKDPLVPIAQSEELLAALKKVSVVARLHRVEGAGHGNGFGKPEEQATLQFFQKYLQKS